MRHAPIEALSGARGRSSTAGSAGCEIDSSPASVSKKLVPFDRCLRCHIERNAELTSRPHRRLQRPLTEEVAECDRLPDAKLRSRVPINRVDAFRDRA